jgi:hypothetical protein
MIDTYSIDDLHASINDIYAQYDQGKIDYVEAEELMGQCCKAFINQFKEEL